MNDHHRGQRTRHDRLGGSPELFFDKSLSGSTPNLELMTVAETATLLKISLTGVRRLQQARQLPFIKVGGSVRFEKRDLATYLRSRRVVPLDQ